MHHDSGDLSLSARGRRSHRAPGEHAWLSRVHRARPRRVQGLQEVALAFLGNKKDRALHPEAVDANLVGTVPAVLGEDADRPL